MSWTINLGFDTNAAPTNPGAENLVYPLLWGVTANGRNYSLADLPNGSSVQFAIYNITTGADPSTTGVGIDGFSISSSSALNTQSNSNPWGVADTNPFSNNSAPSTWSSGNVPCFPTGPDPVMNILTSGGSGILTGTLTNTGQYAFTFNLTINTTGGTIMFFSVDPVMIVTTG